MSFEEDKLDFEAAFGSAQNINIQTFLHLLTSGQPCDITFRNRKPLIDVVLDQEIKYAMMYGAGAAKIQSMLNSVGLKGGGSFNFADVWTISPMPKSGFSKAELDEVDLQQAEDPVGPNGESMRTMISNSYHCENREEEDLYLRRFYAS